MLSLRHTTHNVCKQEQNWIYSLKRHNVWLKSNIKKYEEGEEEEDK